MDKWYLEYSIEKDKFGLLGEVASLIGMLKLNIIKVNGIDQVKRGFLLEIDNTAKVAVLRNVLSMIEHIKLTALRPATLLDEISLRHGSSISVSVEKCSIYRFSRDEIGLLVDFMGEMMKKGPLIIGLRGMPRVGKSEAAIASCVNSNKHWILISATIFQTVIRTNLTEEEKGLECVYLIDGIISAFKGGEAHKKLIQEVIRLPRPKIIEHPDILIEQGVLNEDDIDVIVEIRKHADEVISYDKMKTNFISFDM